jgi:hypothetical protein
MLARLGVRSFKVGVVLGARRVRLEMVRKSVSVTSSLDSVVVVVVVLIKSRAIFIINIVIH